MFYCAEYISIITSKPVQYYFIDYPPFKHRNIIENGKEEIVIDSCLYVDNYREKAERFRRLYVEKDHTVKIIPKVE